MIVLKVKCVGCGHPIDIEENQLGKPLVCGDCETPVDATTYPQIAEAIILRKQQEQEIRMEAKRAEEAREAEEAVSKRRAEAARKQAEELAKIQSEQARTAAARKRGMAARSSVATLVSVLNGFGIVGILVFIAAVVTAMAKGEMDLMAGGLGSLASSLMFFWGAAILGLLADIKDRLPVE